MGESGWDFSKYVDPEQPPAAPSSTGYPPASAPAGASTTTSYAFPDEGGSTSSGGQLERGKPPVLWLLGGGLAAVAGGLLAILLGETHRWAIVAWVLCGPVAIGLLAAFTSFDTRQRARPIYSQEDWVKPVYVACLVLSGVAVVASAYRIADWFGRL